MELKEIPRTNKEALTETYSCLNPAQLKRDIAACQDRLIAMAKTKIQTRKEVSRPPDHSYRRTMSFERASRTSLVMQPMDPSRTS